MLRSPAVTVSTPSPDLGEYPCKCYRSVCLNLNCKLKQHSICVQITRAVFSRGLSSIRFTGWFQACAVGPKQSASPTWLFAIFGSAVTRTCSSSETWSEERKPVSSLLKDESAMHSVGLRRASSCRQSGRHFTSWITKSSHLSEAGPEQREVCIYATLSPVVHSLQLFWPVSHSQMFESNTEYVRLVKTCLGLHWVSCSFQVSITLGQWISVVSIKAWRHL